MPFTSDDDAPWYVRAGISDADLYGDGPVPEIPAELLDTPHTALGDEPPPCDCPHCEEPVTRDTDRGVAPDHVVFAFVRPDGATPSPEDVAEWDRRIQLSIDNAMRFQSWDAIAADGSNFPSSAERRRDAQTGARVEDPDSAPAGDCAEGRAK